MDVIESGIAAQAPASSASTATPENGAGTELFGSFLLGQEEFALPAGSIREVVACPARLTPIPLAPAWLDGVFTLRGTVIPVINLGRIFDPAAPAADAAHRVAIVDRDGVPVGILFHATGEILRIRPEQRSTLHYRQGGPHGIIAGAIQQDDGRRLIRILDPGAVIAIENLPQVRALRAGRGDAGDQRFRRQAQRRQCVAFRVAGASFAFDMAAVQEIMAVPELKESVLASRLCLGWMSLRGRTVPVVRFEALLRPDAPPSSAPSSPAPNQRVVVARIGDTPIGLLVDSVDDMFGFFPDDVLPIPLLGRARAGMFRGCIGRDADANGTAGETGGDTILLDHDAVFSGAELQEITQGHAALYGADGGTTRVANEAASRRRVYIAFAISHAYAVEIGQVREIIGLPEQLVQTPGMPPFVHGLLNLRRQMITLVDPRRVYGMPDAADRVDARVLVIERGEERIGVVVDAVDSIVTVADAHRLRAPRMLHGAADDALQGGLQEVIELPGAGVGETRTLGVFDVDAFLGRLQREMGAAA